MAIKIILPEIKITPEQEEARKKAVLGNDFEKGGILAKILAFISMYEPITATHLSDKLTEYFKEEIDRSAVNRALKKLVSENMIRKMEVGDALTIPHNERKQIEKEIVEKFHIYLERIPKAYRSHYNYLNYYWVAINGGEKYIKWACKLLKFEVSDG